MKNVMIILFLLPVMVFSQPFDTGVRTDIENSWTADQTFITVNLDTISINGPRIYSDGANYFMFTADLQSSSGGGYYLNNSSAVSFPVLSTGNDKNSGVHLPGSDEGGFSIGGIYALQIIEGAGNNGITTCFHGDVKIDSSGSISGNTNVRGTDSFDGISAADSILNNDFTSGDIFFIQFTGAPGDSIKIPFADCREDTLIVRRSNDGDANQAYNWWRLK